MLKKETTLCVSRMHSREVLGRYGYNSRALGGNGAFLQKVNTKFSRILLSWNTSKCLLMLVLKMSVAVFSGN